MCEGTFATVLALAVEMELNNLVFCICTLKCVLESASPSSPSTVSAFLTWFSALLGGLGVSHRACEAHHRAFAKAALALALALAQAPLMASGSVAELPAATNLASLFLVDLAQPKTQAAWIQVCPQSEAATAVVDLGVEAQVRSRVPPSTHALLQGRAQGHTWAKKT
eukprot:CAMPEP_0194490398 /NCGR_PEP_ID=MMETSP0253-20130528/9630_1 /TAXON_ID=2966 /ORGANISM="Noctiluca scintillans" /LENGTH=166 /DNA_ID=CAMNT_0039331017 /DNA_START=347 /DNA_END=845 /DNA_ORIENTATION=+